MEPIALSAGRLGSPLLRMQSDDRLASLAASGSTPAFEALVRRHRGGLVRVCGRVLPEDRAEDAAQQALLNAHQALRRNGAPERFEPWLHRIGVNAALKEVRKAPDAIPLDEERIDGVEQPPEAQERRERVRTAFGAIAALPKRQRSALVARELEGRSHDEIAEALGLSRGAVRQLIHRARNTVRTAASALTPYGLLTRLGAESEPSRIGEVVGGGAGGAVAAKAAVTVMLAGGVAGGVALTPEQPGSEGGGGERRSSGQAAEAVAAPEAFGVDLDGRRGGRHWGDDDNRGPGSANSDRDRGGVNSGPGSVNSGPGSVDSGSGSSGSGSSGSGSSGSGSSNSGSGSGSSGSGSGSIASSGSGSGSSGSGSGSEESGGSGPG
jgi:RNA polymerase sigma factor (sigma-70 family)